MRQDIRDELEDAQANYLAATATTAEARKRRQGAVTAALAAGDTKYAIAKVLGVRAPIVDSIVDTSRREKQGQAEQ